MEEKIKRVFRIEIDYSVDLEKAFLRRARNIKRNFRGTKLFYGTREEVKKQVEEYVARNKDHIEWITFECDFIGRKFSIKSTTTTYIPVIATLRELFDGLDSESFIQYLKDGIAEG